MYIPAKRLVKRVLAPAGVVQRGAQAVLDTPVSWPDLFAAFTSIVAVRTVLELLLDAQHRVLYYGGQYSDLLTYANAYLSWLTTVLVFWMLLRAWLPVDSIGAARLVCSFLPIIWIVPLVNWISTRGAGSELYYGRGWDDLRFNLVHLFNPAAEIAMAPAGVRVEIFIVTISALTLTPWAFEVRWWRALGLALSIYAAIFMLGYLPVLYGLDPAFAEVADYFFIYLPPFLLLSAMAILVLRTEGRLAPGVVRWLLYPSRLLFYLFLAGFGFFLAGHQRPGLLELVRPPWLWRLLCVNVSVTLLFAWARVANDLNDLAIDRVSNTSRPLVTAELEEQATRRLSWVCFALSFLFAVPTDPSFIPYWAIVAALAHLYSVPPLRLRRFYPVAPAVLAAIGTAVFCGGATVIDPVRVYPDLVASGIAPMVFAAAFFLAHLKDFKDLDGDRAGGVQNVFNWLPAKRAAGLLCFFAFAAAVLGLMGRLGLWRPLPLATLGIFVTGASVWALRQSSLLRLERLLVLALGLLGVISCMWLVDQSRLSHSRRTAPSTTVPGSP